MKIKIDMSMNANREIDAEKVRKDFEFESLAPSRMEDGSDNAFSERIRFPMRRRQAMINS